MASLIPDNLHTVAPTEADTQLALESSRQLANYPVGDAPSVRIQVLGDGEKSETIAVPASALQLFVHLLNEMSQGNAVTLLPAQAEVTTEQAAELLNVSESYVVKLLDSARIPSRIAGESRRVRFDELLAYKRRDDENRSNVLDQLTAEAQELGLGY